jgi:hypothetical protein
VAIKETQEINKTQGREEKLPCAECDGKTHHKVLLSVDEIVEEGHGDFHISWDTHYQIVQCQGCKTISFRRVMSNSEEFEQIGPDEYRYIVYEDLYPSRVEGRKGLEDEIQYLPYEVRGIYAETLQALNSRSPILESACGNRLS